MATALLRNCAAFQPPPSVASITLPCMTTLSQVWPGGSELPIAAIWPGSVAWNVNEPPPLNAARIVGAGCPASTAIIPTSSGTP